MTMNTDLPVLPPLEIWNSIPSLGGQITGTREALSILKAAIEQALNTGDGFASWRLSGADNHVYQIDVYCRDANDEAEQGEG